MAPIEGSHGPEPIIVGPQQPVAPSIAQVPARTNVMMNRFRDSADGILWDKAGTNFEYVEGMGDA